MRRLGILALLALGLLQISAVVLRAPALQGLAAATGASPAPKVFTAVQGLETYSSAFTLTYRDPEGRLQQVPFDAELYQRMDGPYNRRNAFGAVLAYAPVLASDPRTAPMFHAVSRHAVCGERVLLREIGIDPWRVAGDVTIELEPGPGTRTELPLRFEVPCHDS